VRFGSTAARHCSGTSTTAARACERQQDPRNLHRGGRGVADLRGAGGGVLACQLRLFVLGAHPQAAQRNCPPHPAGRTAVVHSAASLRHALVTREANRTHGVGRAGQWHPRRAWLWDSVWVEHVLPFFGAFFVELFGGVAVASSLLRLHDQPALAVRPALHVAAQRQHLTSSPTFCITAKHVAT